MTCTCDPNLPITPEPPVETPPIEAPASELPRASGLNIPLHAVLQRRAQWYTEAIELPVGSVSLLPQLTLGATTVDAAFAPEVSEVSVECFPLPSVSFPSGISAEQVDKQTWHISPEGAEYYVALRWVLVKEQTAAISGRFEVSVVPATPEVLVQDADIPIEVKVGDIAKTFNIHTKPREVNPEA